VVVCSVASFGFILQSIILDFKKVVGSKGEKGRLYRRVEEMGHTKGRKERDKCTKGKKKEKK
jgi:hypothetical protein